MKLVDKVALVTGAGSGIGRAIAHKFAEEGARVVVNDINEEAAAETAASIEGEALAVAADVADVDQVKSMFARANDKFGRLDILVNNAGIAETADDDNDALLQKAGARFAEQMSGQTITNHWDVVMNMPDSSWRRMLAVHLDGTFYCSREAVRLMAQHNSGAIISISSVAGLMGLEVSPHYATAKAGILGFTKSLAAELGSRNIRVNAICPGWIDTPMTAGFNDMMRQMLIARTPLQRWGEPEEIASAALFLASGDSAFVTGQFLSPNGGFFMP